MKTIWAFLKTLLVGSKLRLFLIGILLGQGIMYPAVMQWKNTPVEYAIIVPEKDFNRTTPRQYTMKYIKNLRNEKTQLVVNVAPLYLIHEEYKNRFGEYNSNLMGFYDYQKHDIWTVDDTLILVHELRHVFEGSFHRSKDELKNKGRCKIFYFKDIYEF